MNTGPEYIDLNYGSNTKRYYEIFPNIEQEFILSVLNGNLSVISAESNPYSKRILYILSVAHGHSLPEERMNVSEMWEIKEAALNLAAENGNFDIVKNLFHEQEKNILGKNWELYKTLPDPFFEAAFDSINKSSDLASLNALLAKHLISYKRCWGLYKAAKNGHTEIVKLLVNEPEISIENQYFTFLLAAEKGHLPIINFFLTEKKYPEMRF